MIPDAERWNHNIRLFRQVVVPALPPGAQRVLDVGCGEGVLSREVKRLGVPEVVGLDPDEPAIALAREQGGGVDYVLGDLETAVVEPGSFDLVFAVAVLHHTDTEAALRRMAELTRPGGRVAVVGLARTRLPRDLPHDALGFFATRWHSRGREQWHTPAPIVWPPPLTYSQTRQAVGRVLPGARWRRHVLFRWSATWERPGATT